LTREKERVKGEDEGRDEYDQSILYVCRKIE
jgi:hypothetical protein